jgi:hypothetical protein
MSVLLQRINRAEFWFGVRATVPLGLVLVALSVHLAMEVQRSEVARIGVQIDDDLLPAAHGFVEAFHAEAKARFPTAVAGQTYAFDRVVTSDGNLAANTNVQVSKIEAAFASIEADSRAIAFSEANMASCVAPTCGVGSLRAQLNVFRTTMSIDEVLTTLTTISRIIPRTLTAAILNGAASQRDLRLLRRLGVAYVEQLAASYLELTSLHALFHQSQSFHAASAAEATQLRAIESFIMARSTLRYYLYFSDLPFGVANPEVYAAIVTAATTALSNADAILTVSGSQVPPYLEPTALTLSLGSVADLNSLTAAALAVADERTTTHNKTEVRGAWVAVGVLAAVGLCWLVSLALVSRHLQQSSKMTRLVAEFADGDKVQALANIYQPVISGLRTEGLPETRTNTALGRIYDDAARLVMEIRPFLPQTLFGQLVDESSNAGQLGVPTAGVPGSGAGGMAAGTAIGGGRAVFANAAEAAASHTSLGGRSLVAARANTSKPWMANEHSARLDSTVCSAKCTILTVVPLAGKHELRRSPDELLAWYNTLLATVVAMTNEAGGAVHAVEVNGIIVCIWNLCSPAVAAASTALRVARTILANFNNIDLNIVTGPCMVANAKTGRRKNVVVVGSALEFAERVLMLNRLHSCSIVIDFDSFRALSVDDQMLCRPIGTIRNGTASRVVLYSADLNTDEETQNPRRRKDYLAAFSLYQNGMYEDSLALFTDYLRTYGRDHAAEWLVTYLLRHKIGPVNSIAERREIDRANNVDAVQCFQDLAVFGG